MSDVILFHALLVIKKANSRQLKKTKVFERKGNGRHIMIMILKIKIISQLVNELIPPRKLSSDALYIFISTLTSLNSLKYKQIRGNHA